jgi:hypothetical protein
MLGRYRRPCRDYLLEYKSSVLTPSTDAKRKSSLSLTQRNRASICDNVARLISRPLIWQRLANCSWVRPNLLRKRLICGPTTFAGIFVWAMLRILSLTLKGKGCWIAKNS